MDWVVDSSGGVATHIGSDKGVELVRLYVRPRFAAPGEGIEGWTISRYEVADAVKTKKDHQALTAALIERAIEQGWVTEDDVVAHELVREGGKVREIRAGRLVVKYPDDPTEIMGFRASAREKAEEVAARKHVDLEPADEAVAVVLGRDGKAEGVSDAGQVEPDKGRGGR